MPRLLKTLVFALALSLVPALAQAQSLPGQTLKHEFSDRTVYIQVSGSELLTVSNENGRCLAYISIVEWTEDSVRFKGGTEWKVEKVSDEVLEIAFPSRSPWLAPKKVRYRKTDEDPFKGCENMKRRGKEET